VIGFTHWQEIPEQLPEARLPLGIPFTRWFFGASQGIQIAVLSAAAALGLAVLTIAFLKRRSIVRWLQTRPLAIRIALGVVALVLLGSMLGAGRASWNYMQHDNDFCTGCHVMDPAFERFTRSGHAELSCHNCHQQSVFASMRQLREWIRDRPEEIGEHAPVPNEICAQCHIRDDPQDNWFQIANTAGHIVHLQSDSSALAGLQCVTCHGQEVHQFLPADQTCGQANCHAEETTRIVLGEMTGQQGLHCVTCHEFTAEPVAPTAVDSATSPLSPGLAQCTSCHEMDEMWAKYDPVLDPHDAKCGACHNPHVQETPELALRSCTSAGCHARPDTLSTMHIGLAEDVESNCIGCHRPHVWVRNANDCADCHTDILGSTASAPLPEGHPDATLASALPEGHPAALLASTLPAGHPAPVRSPSRASPAAAPAGRASGPGAEPDVTLRHVDSIGAAGLGHASAVPDDDVQNTFTHRQHRNVACTECHSNAREHGEVTVRTQSDCFACHHATRTATAGGGCGNCHGPAELGRTQQVTLNVRLSVWDEARPRGLPFRHDAHPSLRCVDCHGGGTRQRVQTTCSNCHEDHHPQAADVSCAACHEAQRQPVHTADVHTQGCTGSGCHQEARFDRMQRTRNFCLTCHENMATHEPQEACIRCHLVPTGGSSAEASTKQ